MCCVADFLSVFVASERGIRIAVCDGVQRSRRRFHSTSNRQVSLIFSIDLRGFFI